jgi:hypothetical protein
MRGKSGITTHLPDTWDVLRSQHTGEIDDCLHALDLTLYNVVVVFLSSGGEGQEVNRSDILLAVRVWRRVWHETMIDVFGSEGGEGGLREGALAGKI